MSASQPAATNSGGIGITGLLFVLFVGLKLTNNIAWSWWWVWSPIWGSISLALFFCVVYVLFKAASER